MSYKKKPKYPIDTLFLQLENVQSELIGHQFNELVYIYAGEGLHTNHQTTNAFSAGDMFLIQTKELHQFSISGSAEIYIVRYTEAARVVLKELIESSQGRAVALSKAKSPLNLKINFSAFDKTLVEQILKILYLLSTDAAKNENNSYFQLLCLINIIERNLPYVPSDLSLRQRDIVPIIGYIHQHIKDPARLKLKQIAENANFSMDHLSRYFRKEMGMSVKQYIVQCRMEVIEKKVLQEILSFSEITHQFGFVDETHFCKSFKKYFGSSPSQYKQLWELKHKNVNLRL